MTPTDEQQAIVGACRTGKNLVIEAGAGTGKTTTLRMVGTDNPGRKGIYVAYNRAVAQDARKSFPGHVNCATAHSFAYGAVGRQFAGRLNGPRVPAWQAARILRIREPVAVADNMALLPEQLARLVLETVGRFCRSADRELTARHVPRKTGLDTPENLQVLREVLPPLARRAWADLTSQDGQLRFEHDVYLKMWQLSDPQLPADYILLDEAQDADPVIASVVLAQGHAQLIAVGDRCQAIYRWRGAVDAMRTNARAMGEAISAMAAGRKVALVRGAQSVLALAQAAVTLMDGNGCSHPELFAFQSWDQVREYAELDPGGSDLAVFVKLIDDHGPQVIIDAARKLADEEHASLIISTAHSAKGREWDTVRIATDFHEPGPRKAGEPPRAVPARNGAPAAGGDGEEGEIRRDEAMLAYVAVTRARHVLDREGLEWVDRFL